MIEKLLSRRQGKNGGKEVCKSQKIMVQDSGFGAPVVT
jgi:hypothetical protein